MPCICLVYKEDKQISRREKIKYKAATRPHISNEKATFTKNPFFIILTLMLCSNASLIFTQIFTFHLIYLGFSYCEFPKKKIAKHLQYTTDRNTNTLIRYIYMGDYFTYLVWVSQLPSQEFLFYTIDARDNFYAQIDKCTFLQMNLLPTSYMCQFFC